PGLRPAKKSRPADMCGWTGHIQGNLALRVCEPPCGECAVQHQILSPGGYQGERISVPHMRAEMGSPWSVARCDTLTGQAGRACPVCISAPALPGHGPFRFAGALVDACFADGKAFPLIKRNGPRILLV